MPARAIPDLRSFTSFTFIHLFAAGVEGLLQLLSGFWDETFLNGGKVMRILEGDLQLVSVLLQRAQEVLREAAWKQNPTEMVSYVGGRGR